ncbi:contact-dependent growth inhibition system immunity protein [Azotosporobacter soli]|uniref:contact-dependent growth inhibition system immunity protein n=1 Tax=Azotosporobacter soli TaxID=3055040 RepID=UPI0031FEBCF7
MNENMRNSTVGEIVGGILNSKLGYGLSDWFKALQNKKLKEIKDEDISRLIRQGVIVKYAVFEATNRLLENPTMGIYDGEGLAEISKLSQEFWCKNDSLRIKLKAIIFQLTNNNLLENFEWMSESCKKEFSVNLETLKTKLLE